MKKTKIFLGHLAVFIVGSIGIVIYVFNRLATPSSSAGLGGVIVMPVIIVMYIIVFGIFCAISLGISFLISHLRNRNK